MIIQLVPILKHGTEWDIGTTLVISLSTDFSMNTSWVVSFSVNN